MSAQPRLESSQLFSRNIQAQDSSQPPPIKPNPPNIPSGSAPRKRTSHACDRCRLMRTKCSGGTRCIRCTKDDAVCVYGYHKREQNKQDLADTRTRVKELESENRNLLSALRQVTATSSFQDDGHGDVLNLLSQYQEDDSFEGSSSSPSLKRDTLSRSGSMVTTRQGEGGEGSAPSSVGSPGRQGELHKIVNLDHGMGAAGVLGKMSEMSWMQRCREYLIDRVPSLSTDIDLPKYDKHTAAAGNLTYFTDDLNLLSIDEDKVDSTQWPPFEAATICAEAYFHVTEGAFEFVLREEFFATMYTIPRDGRLITWSQRRWLAIANLIWAIGARWLNLAGLDEPEFLESHLVYFARARALGLDHRVSFDHPDVQTVQGIGLLTFYLLVNGSITRAWNTVGNAIRHAMSLGLYLRVSDPSIDVLEQRRRAFTWFSLYKLQVLLAEITGRPQLVRTACVTIPLDIFEDSPQDLWTQGTVPVDIEPCLQAKEIWTRFISFRTGGLPPVSDNVSSLSISLQSNLPFPHGLFSYHVRLCQLSEEIADQLYTGRQDIPWSQTQERIEALQEALDAWHVTLPDDLKLSSLDGVSQHPQANIQLAMYSYSVAMMLHRPCLCEIRINNESDRSKEFNIRSARLCVRAALSMVDLMPGEFVPHKIFQLLPWWTLLHYICQAASVLLLELCLNAQHCQGETGHIVVSLWKIMSYLACMSENSMSAYKAWRVFREFLVRVSSRYGDAQLYDVNQEVVPPTGWAPTEESALLAALQ